MKGLKSFLRSIFSASLLTLGVVSFTGGGTDKIVNAATYTAVETPADGGKYLITTTYNSTTTYYLPSDMTSSAPVAAAFTDVNKIEDSNLFTFTASGDNWVVRNNDGNYLHATDTNNGVRIVSSSANTWTYDNHIMKCSTERFLGIYNSQDWRSYKSSSHGNYNGSAESIQLYEVSSGSQPTYDQYTATLHYNNGEADGTIQSSASTGKYGEPTVPTYNYYDFAGWYSDEEFTTEFDFAATAEANIDLYANWVETECTALNNVTGTDGTRYVVKGKVVYTDADGYLIQDAEGNGLYIKDTTSSFALEDVIKVDGTKSTTYYNDTLDMVAAEEILEEITLSTTYLTNMAYVQDNNQGKTVSFADVTVSKVDATNNTYDITDGTNTAVINDKEGRISSLNLALDDVLTSVKGYVLTTSANTTTIVIADANDVVKKVVSNFEEIRTTTKLGFKYSTSGEVTVRAITDVADLTTGSYFIGAVDKTDSTTVHLLSNNGSNNKVNAVDETSVNVESNNVSNDYVWNITVTDTTAVVTNGESYLQGSTRNTNLNILSTSFNWTVNAVNQVPGLYSSASRCLLYKNGGIYGSYDSGHATEADYTTPTFYKIDDQSSTTYSDYQFRFGCSFDQNVYDTFGTVSTVGVLVAPTAELGSPTFAEAYSIMDSDFAAMVELTSAVDMVATLQDNAGVYSFGGVLSGIPEAELNTELTAVCYVINSVGNVYFAQQTAYSVASAASYYSTNAEALGLTTLQVTLIKGLEAKISQAAA